MSRPALHLVDAGQGAPPVVLLHGLTATHRYVTMGSKALERAGHRVLAYDARGHGASAPGDRYDYPALVGDLLALLDEHGLERPVLAGASMGAHTAIRLALEHPGRLGGLVVITPAHHPDAPKDLDRWDRLAAGLRADGIDGFVAAYDLDSSPPAWRETIERVLRQRLAQHEDLPAVADAVEQVPRSEPFDVDRLGELELPTLVVADRDEADPGHPLWVGELYARRIPGASLLVEPEGSSPIAWQGGQLSKAIAGLAAGVLG